MDDGRNNIGRPDNRAKQASLLASAGAARQRAARNTAEPSAEDAPLRAQGQQSQQGSGSQRGRHARHARQTPNAQQHQQAPGQESYSQREPLSGFVRRNAVYVLSVVAIVAIVALMLVLLRPSGTQEEQPVVEEDVFVDPFNWENLDRTDGRYRYVVDGQVKSRLGIDVSENQHDIDWNAVAADGIEFAMIRLGYRGATVGDMYVDEYFDANLEGAKEAGIDCGVYFFSQAKTVDEAIAEANFVMGKLAGRKLEYPIAFDSEEAVMGTEEARTSGLDEETMTAIAEAFCTSVEKAGYRTLVYGNVHDLSRYHYENMQARDLWWAEYGVPSPTAQIDIVMWQYSNSGNVAGIETAVDMDIDLSGAL